MSPTASSSWMTARSSNRGRRSRSWTIPDRNVPSAFSEWSNGKSPEHRKSSERSRLNQTDHPLTPGARRLMKASAKDYIQLDRLVTGMDTLGLDAIVARAGINFTYLAAFAYPGTLARHLDLSHSPRAVYLVWPRNGEPRMVVNAIAEGLARRDSFIEQFDVYAGYSEPPIERLAQPIPPIGTDDGQIRL